MQEYRRIVNRQRRLPDQLTAARRRVRDLELEAKRYGMFELLSNPKHVNQAWDEAIDQGRAATGYPDVVAEPGSIRRALLESEQ